MSVAASPDTYFLTRFYFQRALGFIYSMGFLIAVFQYRGLCGKDGIEPLPLFLKNTNFWSTPSVFWFNQSDGFILLVALAGLAISIFAMLGYSDAFGLWVSVGTWLSLWLLYMSFVNVGQTFYSFGWEVLLLETGFLAIFLGPSSTKPPIVVIFLLRWLLFRLMFGAGMIKIRGDDCWRDLTCMQYHYETMPLPGPTSWYFHALPQFIQKSSVVFNHFVELAVPFFYFFPRPLRHTAGILTIIFQFIIILSGNFSWLNHLSIVIALACFDDSILPQLAKWTTAMGVPGAEAAAQAVMRFPAELIYALAVLVGYLSISPIQNLLSKNQVMNTSFEPFHIVNTYGAFGSITRTRDEIILEGANTLLGPWKEYNFKAKPGDVSKMPPFVSPYHYKIDWQMWFAAMGPYYYQPWIINFIAKLLRGTPQVMSLIGPTPFPNQPPKYIRALLYEYHYTHPHTGTQNWWNRELKGTYLPPLALDDPSFRQLLFDQGWL